MERSSIMAIFSKKLKIFFLDHLPFKGGAQLVLRNHLEYLNKDQFDPYLITDENSNLLDLFETKTIRVVKIRFGRLKPITLDSILTWLQSIADLNKQIGLIKPDLLVVNTERGFLIAAWAFFFKPKVIFVRDYDYSRLFFVLLKNRFSRRYYVSNSLKEFYKDGDGEVIYVPSDMAEKIARIKNGRMKGFRSHYNIKDSDILIGFVGRLVEWKGVLDLVEAIADLDGRVKLIICGSGQGQENSVEAQLAELIKSKGLADRIILTGHIDEIEAVYSALNIFVLPSKKPEPFATSMVAAAQAKLAIVASNCGGTREFIEDSKTGLLYEPGNIDELRKKLEKLIGNPVFCQKLAISAFQKSLEFTEDKINLKLEKDYLDLIKK